MPFKRTGDILLESGLISDQQLKKALSAQHETKKRLGEVLIDLGFISEQQLVEVLEFQLGIPHVQLFHLRIKPSIINVIPSRLAEKYRVLPLGKRDDKLQVAMDDPLNYYAIEEIEMMTGLRVEVLIATRTEMEAAIKRYYSLQESVAELGAPGEQEKRAEDEAGEDSPVSRAVQNIIARAVEYGASDIHMDPQTDGLHIRFRIDGVMRSEQVIRPDMQNAVVARVKVIANLNIAEHRLPQDGRLEVNVDRHRVDIRVSVLPTMNGEKVVLRILDKARVITDIKQLGFTAVNLAKFSRLINYPYGAVLIAGPTGSGKTTTLYAALSYLNKPEINIITIEDPVEFRLPGVNQVPVNAKIGMGFAGGLRAILRQDPNIIMVGEIRDQETAEISMRAAVTGHLVLSTLHTNDTSSSLTRLIDMGVEPFMVASAVVGVVAQRLVRRVCPHCAVGCPPSLEEGELLARYNLPSTGLKKGAGCAKCGSTGFLGRMGIHELMDMDDNIRAMILRLCAVDNYRRHMESCGVDSMLADGLAKASQGLTTCQEVLRVMGGVQYGY